MANWAWSGDWGDQDDDNEFQGYKDYSTSKDSLILLIDCSRSMFTKTDESDCPIDLCIKCVKSVLMNKIISNDKDMVGVVFFGTEKDKNPSDFKHVYVYQELDSPDVSRIKEIDDMIKDQCQHFASEVGHSDSFSLSDVLWTCSSMLATSASKYGHKRILLFTNCDNPHAHEPALQRQAKTRAKDLAENGVEIELMHIGNNFDFTAFYQDIVFTGGDVVTLPKPSEKFEELLTRVRSKEFNKRAIHKLSLELGNGVEIGGGIFCPVREAKKPSFVRLDQRTNDELKTQTKMLCEDTGTELLPTDIKYYQQLGGEKVVFEKEEVQEIKKMSNKGLTLMGFKPLSKLKEYHYIKPASFFYPEDTEVRGSAKLFSALLEKCLSRSVCAVCRYVPTSNAAPRFVALVPQVEELDESEIQVSAPGFHVIFLPYSEEVRVVQCDKTATATSEQVDVAKDIVKKLTFNFQSDSFENPVLQKHYRHLEAIALEKDTAEDIVDLTTPDSELIERRAGGLLDQLKSLAHLEDSKAPSKRKASAKEPGSSKKSKVSDSSETTFDRVLSFAKERKLDTLKVPELKEYLKAVGKKVAGRKQDLIEEIYNHLGYDS